MNLELNEQQADVLREALRSRVDLMEREFLHTDSREFRKALRGRIDTLESVLQQLIDRTESQNAYA